MKNPILDELHAAREQLLAEAGGDIHRYLEGVREREAASGRLLARQDESAAKEESHYAGPRGGTASPSARA